MTPNQRSHYFGRLWPQACAAQGWDSKDEHQRKRVTYAATGEESTSALNQDQITLLFKKLEWLADPTDYDKALADSDPQAAVEASHRAKIIWRIEQAAAKVPGDAEAWLHTTTAGKCREHGVLEWRALPTPELLRLSYTASARTTDAARARRAAKKAAKTRPAHPMQGKCTPKIGPEPDMPF